MSESGPPERANLAKALANEEARLRRLEVERAEAAARADALRAELATLDEPPVVRGETIAATTTASRSPTEKVKLFRQLFRGRDDLYPTRFVSQRTGKTGYAPACSNKFVAGLCVLPKVKCGDCTNQAFRRVDDPAVLGHLRGKHVMGVYPMLPDETCWFLAVDFDKGTWKEDVHAFAETARRLGLPALVERSRSGNGAHVWFFFSEPVPAGIARKLGCHVITETMASRHELSMESYDRLFPSQDTMPRGGFGNLIALPLQHEPRQQRNSVFLDEAMNAYPDDQQWSLVEPELLGDSRSAFLHVHDEHRAPPPDRVHQCSERAVGEVDAGGAYDGCTGGVVRFLESTIESTAGRVRMRRARRFAKHR